MKIGILITSVSNFGEKGFYNAQEIGLAKAMSKTCEKVSVYKLVPLSQKRAKETLENHDNVTVYRLPAKNSGINGVINTEQLEDDLDALIHFSDTQFSVPKVYEWTVKNGIKYIPYIGVIESHSTSAVKRFITNLKFRKNLQIYKKCHCLAKTPQVQDALESLGVKDVKVAPVGLDMSLLRKDYTEVSADELKETYGYGKEEKVLLFIGRLIEEKQPVKMIEIFHQMQKMDENYRLLLVGSGELKEKVVGAVQKYGLESKVQLLEKIPNDQIWQLYRIADAFVNLNQQEIFGMAILEAMYYGCKVVAWEAPGPNYIIQSGVSGWLVSKEQDVIEKIHDNTSLSDNAHQRIRDCFTWESAAKTMVSTAER